MLKKLAAPLILGLSGCATLLALMVWQIERLAWKESQIANIEETMNGEPSDLFQDYMELGYGYSTGMKFELSGKFLNRYTDKLSGAGYHRIMPFETGGHIIMLEVGFVDQTKKADEFTLPEGTVRIIGHVYDPDGDGTIDRNKNIWVGYNIDDMAKYLRTQPFLLIANKSPIDGINDAPFTIDLPNNHQQYAITWGLLALAWGAMTVYWGYSRIRTRKNGIT